MTSQQLCCVHRFAFLAGDNVANLRDPVHVTNELSGLVALDGQALPSHQELSLRVFVKEAGAWRVAAFQNTMIRPFNNP